ncbi:MFS transporter [Actinoalloteichus spitiensis]|uniref:MFS transporter n=1 Tax=Actinoalloteichus spitiensis TaxID=252394 RepID=UPI000380489F|nr:MFS transporter [Actinoalloteichus spitiensis]
MRSAAGERQKRRTPETGGRLPVEIWVLCVANFVIAVGFGIVAPALPTFAASFDVGVTAVSMIVSAFAAMRLLFAPLGGRLVTRLGERPVYLVGLSITGVATGACAFAAEYWQMLLFRSLGGIGSTMFTVSGIALLIRLAPATMRGRASGLWATSFLLGNIAGPLIGGGLVETSIRAPFLIYAGMTLLAVLGTWFFLRNSTLAAREDQDSRDPLSVRDALRNATYRAALVSNFAHGWAVFGVRISLLPLFVVEALRVGESMAGISLAVFAAGNAVVLVFSGRLADRIGRKPLVLVGLLVSAGGTAWLGFTTTVPAFLAASLVAGLGAGLLSPPQGAAVADVIGRRGGGGPVLAGFQMAADVGAIVGPLLAGLLVDVSSYGLAFGVTGAIAVVASLFWAFAPETLPSNGADPAETGSTVAAESGALDEGPEPPSGERVAEPAPPR